jgi:hypothetical protein
MGELFSFPSRLRHGVMEAVRGPRAAKARLNTITKEPGTALVPLDQMAVKIEQMNRLLPIHLVSRIERPQLEVLDQINQVRLTVASLSGFPKD